MRRLTIGIVAIAAAVAAAASVVAPPGPDPVGARPTRRVPIVFNGEGNNLNAYESVPPFRKQRVITTRARSRRGLDINAQICFFPGTRHGVRRFVAGEDTGQPNPPQGWGIFELRGDRIGRLRARKIGKLTPTYQGSTDNAENYGCGFLRDGRVLTTDIGNQASGSGDGQLIVWFPPFDRTRVRYCKIDVGIATAGGLLVGRGDRVYVTSARAPTAGVWRYTGPFPTSNTAAGGCGKRDGTGAPLADSVAKELFIAPGGPLLTPNAIAPSPRGYYVSSVINGVIAEFDRDGRLLRTVLSPPAGETLGARPYSTGTPLGIGVDRHGDLFYADIGIVISADGIGPGNRTGTVRRIRFVHGRPRPPRLMDRRLAFPDGIGVLDPNG